jgi:hypothetical protein
LYPFLRDGSFDPDPHTIAASSAIQTLGLLSAKDGSRYSRTLVAVAVTDCSEPIVLKNSTG